MTERMPYHRSTRDCNVSNLSHWTDGTMTQKKAEAGSVRWDQLLTYA